MKDLSSVITVELEALRALFQAWDFDLRLVGGVVRDMLSDVTPKDVDICTDADPEQMMMIFREHGVTFYETGLQHGTLTVNLNGQIYEITSLRTDSNHDGRHAEVTYTRDWLADLARRDLTVNAMALTFDGELVDPFDGAADLAAQKVRFVGDADQRMREDYLRILRFFRFHARIANTRHIEPDIVGALVRNAQGLRTISKERVWQEMQKIVAGNVGPEMIEQMQGLGVAWAIGLRPGNPYGLARAWMHTRDPVSLIAAYQEEEADHLLANWRASTAERQQARFIATHWDAQDAMFLLAHDRAPRQHVAELMRVRGAPWLAEYVESEHTVVPVFPITGEDLLQAGVPRGPEIGRRLAVMRKAWAVNGYREGKASLLALHISDA